MKKLFFPLMSTPMWRQHHRQQQSTPSKSFSSKKLPIWKEIAIAETFPMRYLTTSVLPFTAK